MSKKFVLPKKTQEWLEHQPMSIGRKNLYTCDLCGGEVVTVDLAKGVTPFMIACRATHGCDGAMTSSFYHCNPFRPAQFEWYRPETVDDFGPETIEHLEKGGLLLRPVAGAASDVPADA